MCFVHTHKTSSRAFKAGTPHSGRVPVEFWPVSHESNGKAEVGKAAVVLTMFCDPKAQATYS